MTRNNRRAGMTLVEMLVALALTIFLMAILSEVFVVSLESFRKLKALADLEQELRNTAGLLRRDLQANHFEGDKRLSQLTPSGQPFPIFDANVPAATRLAYLQNNCRLVPPQMGFFAINESTNPRLSPPNPAPAVAVPGPANPIRPMEFMHEGWDATGRPLHRDNNDELQFTVRLNGNRRENFFSARVPQVPTVGAQYSTTTWYALDNIGRPESRYDGTNDGRYTSQWAEVAWFLRRTGRTTAGLDVSSNTGLNPMNQAQANQYVELCNLYRIQLPLLVDGYADAQAAIPTGSGIATYPVATYNGLPSTGPADANNVVDTNVNGSRYLNYFSFYDVSAARIPVAGGANPTYHYFFNSPADVQFRERRYGFGLPNSGPWSFANPPTIPTDNRNFRGRTSSPAGGPRDLNHGRMEPLPGTRTGADLIMSNVISFDVKVWDPVALQFVDLGYMPPTAPAGAAPPAVGCYYATATPGAGGRGFFYDTWSLRNGGYPWENYGMTYEATFTPVAGQNHAFPGDPGPYVGGTVPYPYPISTLQIKIRVWEPKARQTREITIIQDM